MKKLILFWAALALPLFADIDEIGGIATSTLDLTGYSEIGGQTIASAGPTYIYEESFEGTGYENTWTEVIGNADEDYTGFATDGSQSLRMDDASFRNEDNSAWTAESGTTYIYFTARMSTLGTTSTYILFRNGTSTICSIDWRSDTEFRVNNTGGTFAQTTGGEGASGAWVYFWVEQTPGSGSDAQVDVYISATSTKPGSATLSSTDGTTTVGIDGFRIVGASGNDLIIDDIKVSASVIGSAP